MNDRDRSDLTPADLEQLARRGIPEAEARRQLDLLRDPPGFARLVRPCAVEDGIVRLAPDQLPRLYELHAGAAQAGRFRKFVPASGAASRMFRDLLHFQRGPGRQENWNAICEAAGAGDLRAGALVEFIDNLDRFAFREALGEVLDRQAASGGHLDILDALLDSEGLDYDDRPKGVLLFHEYPNGCRTPFEEHLVEAAEYARDGEGRCRLHFTVSSEHRAMFHELLDASGQRLERLFEARFEVGFSTQKPSTDTLAVGPDDRPLRDTDGRLLFRPGGHGALIENLDDLGGDLVYVKNIDNVQPDHRKPLAGEWKRALGGYLVALQDEVRRQLERLRGPQGTETVLAETMRFAGSRLQVELNGRLDRLSPADRRAWLIRRLDRPLRVCGVVPNRGEPGGGPFWVRDRDGAVSLQIVEGAQIDPHDDGQQAILRGSTHFNPVDLVCAVRDARDRPYDLNAFIDPGAAIVSEKSDRGRELKALERPGLWNGAMAGWNTVFVEVPLETFSPVKTVLDLLREEHQPPA